MPFYNSEDYIERAVLSVINQTYDNWELIAVNDGSKDKSNDIVCGYAKKDKRIRVLMKENGGYATAINFGLDNLSDDSDYFLMLGSDDELSPNLFKNINKEAATTRHDIIGFKTIIKTDNKEIYDEESFVSSSIYECNKTVVLFYQKHPNIPKLFYVRDTSRLYKTSMLGNLRYFGKTGIDADGIFSIMFCDKCTSFAHLNIDGYVWNKRKDSVSSGRLSNTKRADSLNNWISFFKWVRNNDVDLDKCCYDYLNNLWANYYYFVQCSFKIFKSLKKDLYRARKILKIYYKQNFFQIPKNNKKYLYFPSLVNISRYVLRRSSLNK